MTAVIVRSTNWVRTWWCYLAGTVYTSENYRNEISIWRRLVDLLQDKMREYNTIGM